VGWEPASRRGRRGRGTLQGRAGHAWAAAGGACATARCHASHPPPAPRPRPSPQSPLASIPQFYYPGGRPPLSDDAKTAFGARVGALFGPHPGGLNLEQFSRVVQDVCGMPTILAHPWFERLVAGRPARLVERGVFVDWWVGRGLVAAPASKRLWEVLRPEGRNHLTYDDFKPLLQVREGGRGRGRGWRAAVRGAASLAVCSRRSAASVRRRRACQQ
jgi:hypothetical protein